MNRKNRIACKNMIKEWIDIYKERETAINALSGEEKELEEYFLQGFKIGLNVAITGVCDLADLDLNGEDVFLSGGDSLTKEEILEYLNTWNERRIKSAEMGEDPENGDAEDKALEIGRSWGMEEMIRNLANLLNYDLKDEKIVPW